MDLSKYYALAGSLVSLCASERVCVLMYFCCVHPKPIFFLSELLCFLATSTDASCVCCAHAIDKGIQEFEQFV